MAKELTKVQVIAKIRQVMKRIEKDRDELRDLIGDAEHIQGNCESALRDLERAADDLSELL